MCLRPAVVAVVLVVGCSSFRAVEAEPADAASPDGGGTATLDGGPADAAVDLAATPTPIPIDIEIWSSPNGAGTSHGPDGFTTIATKGLTNHPVIVPVGLPDFGSDDYTIYATVISAKSGDLPGLEFGFVVRLPANPSEVGYLLGSTYGDSGDSFFGVVSPPGWEPTSVKQASSDPVAPGERYNVKIKAEGATLSGKRWRADAGEPAWQLTFPNARTEGRGIGFYTYYTNDTEVVSLAYTVP